MQTITTEERARIVAEARRWIKTPYAHRQCVLGAAADCATLLTAVYPVALPWMGEIPLPEYPSDWFMHRNEEWYLQMVEQYAVRLPDPADPQPGDLVVLKYGRTFAHGAIIVEWPTVIHAYRSAGMVTLDDMERNREISVRERRFYTPRVGI